VHPSSGPLAGGTLVEVRGARIALPDGRGLFCQFGGAEAVAATHSSRELVRCVAPPSARGAVGAVALRLVNNDAVYGAAVAYTYRALVEVRRVHPVLGLRTGGTLVTLYGSGLVGAPSARCRFGEVAVPARLLSAGQLECTSPRPAAPGYVALEVSTNGRDFSASGVHFEYLRPVALRALEPVRGPVGGGTFVNVTGSGFSARSAQLGYVWCRFNTSAVAAAWARATEVHCIAPAHAPGVTVVALTLNEQQHTSGGARFEYEVGAAHSVHPSSGPLAGGTLVEVRGARIALPDGRGLF
jgi:hypothetical protein